MDRNLMFSTNKKNQNTLSSFDVRESTGPIGLLKFLIAISLLITVFILCLKVYQGGVRDRSEPPTIAGDKTPFKVILEEHGGVETPDQDKNIYSVMDNTKLEVTVTPREVTESPIDFSETIIQNDMSTPKKPNPVSSSVNIKSSGPGYIKSAPNIESEFVIQLASVRSNEAAKSFWEDVKVKYKNLIKSELYHDIKTVDLGNKGIYYRLRIAGFENKEMADIFCDKLKELNQACFVTRK